MGSKASLGLQCFVGKADLTIKLGLSKPAILDVKKFLMWTLLGPKQTLPNFARGEQEMINT